MHRPGSGVSDYQCRPSRRRKDADDALMSADNKSPFGFVTLGAAGLIALAVAASARAEVAGAPAAASSQRAAERAAGALPAPAPAEGGGCRAAASAQSAAARRAPPAPACNAPTELTRLVHPLT